jgi:ATP-dependent DNA helicase RecQ
VLSLTTTSRQLLRGERRLELSFVPKPQRRQRGADTRGGGAVVGDAGPEQALFERLRSLRKSIADRQGVPPYVIFHDATLREMVSRRPADLEAFARLPGVGQAKLARYAEPFIEALRDAGSR